MPAMQPKTDFDIAIIGAGIVGLATAYKIALAHPSLRICLFEKEKEIAAHQTGHNSGVIHSGLYYQPGSIKAKTCREGRRELVEFAQKHHIPFDMCGKIVVATHPSEVARLDQLYERAQANQLAGVEKIDAHQIKEIEPECSGIAGLRVPCTGIIDFVQVARTLAEQVQAIHAENRLKLEHRVIGFDRHDYYTKLVTNQGPFRVRNIVNCAGLQSDRIADLVDVRLDMRIVPFRGEYHQLIGAAKDKVKHLIYPVPDPRFPFLGVHFTRTIGGEVECGPNAVFSWKREGYHRLSFDFRDSWDALSFAGTRALFRKNLRYGIREYAQSLCKPLLVRQLKRLIPSVTSADLQRGHCGVRAQAVSRNGEPVDDFKIEHQHNFIHVLNAPSPAATAALAIGSHIQALCTSRFNLKG